MRLIIKIEEGGAGQRGRGGEGGGGKEVRGRGPDKSVQFAAFNASRSGLENIRIIFLFVKLLIVFVL